MSNKFLALNGDILQLQFLPSNDGRRYNVTVIGYLQGRSLMVATPKKDGNYMLIREGQIFNARMMHGVTVSGFQTQVIKSVTSPYPYLHLKIPSDWQSKQVRHTRRADTELEVLVTNIKKMDLIQQRSAKIIDISLYGCRMVTEDIIGSEGDKLKINFDFRLFEHNFLLSITAEVKRFEETLHDQMQMFEYGLAFLDIGEQASLLIGSYVNEVLIQKFLE